MHSQTPHCMPPFLLSNIMSSLCFSISLFFILFLSSSSAHSIHDDRKSLLELKSLIANDPHHSMANWTPAIPFCNWTGITCTRRRQMDRVIALNLTAIDLQGRISPSIGNLSFLRSLDLSDNAHHGSIPPQIGRLFRLRKLWLHHNQLKGSIPSHLASCRNLVDLTLSYNNLSGSVPVELGSLARLKTLYMGANDLTDMSGHVTDFGIARLIGAFSTDSITSTLALKGSAGYIAPEYGLDVTISTKGDVYSYGILLLEMLTGKRPTSDMFVGDLNLHKWINLAFPGRVKEVIDKSLLSEVDEDAFEENDVYKCLVSLLRVGLLCSKDSPEERPTMRDVAMALESFRKDLVGNTTSSRRLGRNISNLLGNTSARKNFATTSNDQSSSTF